MRHKLLGRSGLRVSELCLGSMTFGETRRWGADEASSHEIMRAFAEAGGTFIDTAPNYAGGAAEEIIGRLVAGQRDRFVIGTKFTAASEMHPLAGGNSRKSVMRSVEASLRRLGTDHIDILWLHFWDATTPVDEVLRAFDDLVSAGKILYAGFSDTPAWLISRAVTLAELRGWARVVAVQLEYNLAARTAERELLPMAAGLDLAAVCWAPFAAGAIAGSDTPQRRKIEDTPPALAEAAERLAAIAADEGVSARALALRWLLDHPHYRNLVPVVGARTVGQLRETLSALAAPASKAALRAVSGIAPPSLGFPHELIASPYLRKFASGGADIEPAMQPRS